MASMERTNSKLTFEMMCSMLAAKNRYESGQSIAKIAASAKKSPATIRRWLKRSGVTMERERGAK